MPTLVLVSVAFFLIVVSFPIYLAILSGTLLSFEWLGPMMSGRVLPQRLVEGINVFALLSVPLFIFAADIVGRGQIGAKLVSVMEGLVGHLKGGLAIATVLACAMFGAISGIGAAAVVSIGPIVYPALIRTGYSRGFAVGLILSASTLAMVIPPGVAMILYSVQTSTSVAKVFLGGLASGIWFIVIVGIYCWWYARRHNIATSQRVSWSENWVRIKDAVWAIGLPVVIFGGIYSGVFTPTEAAAAACAYAAVVETLIYRQVSFKDLFKLSQTSAIMISTLMIVISVGSLMTWFLTLEQVPAAIVSMLGDVPSAAVLAVINVLFLIAGMFIDPNSAVIIMSPLIYPAAAAIGIDPVHLGVVVVFNLAIGMVTPPFGLNIFIGIATFRLPYLEIVKSTIPFILLSLLTLLLITYIPELVLWLPNLAHS